MNQDAIAIRLAEIGIGLGGGLGVAGAFVAGVAVGARLAVEDEAAALSLLASWKEVQHSNAEATDYDSVVSELIEAAR